MRPGGTQTKRGAAVRMRRRLGLAPRAYALLSCSLVLVIAGVSAYGMTVPPMMQAHAAREPRVGHEVKSDLGTTTGYAWASVVAHIVFGTGDADGAEAPDNEVTLANGKTIVLTNTKIIGYFWLRLGFVEFGRWLWVGFLCRRVWKRRLDGRQH